MVARGRPRSFSREQALDRAVELFWARGYERATLSELQKAMGGISAPSFYAAFGSKEALFREAVQRYNQVQGVPTLKALAEGVTARASMEGLLRAGAMAVTQQGHPRGCLTALSGIESAAEADRLGAFMREMRAQRQKIILQRLERGVTDGDVPKGANLKAVAFFYVTVIDGLTLQARDGVSRETLETIGQSAMQAWDGLVGQKRPRPQR